MHPAGLPASLAAVDRTLVMGVVNVTPDSFSDGGRYLDAHAAIEHGISLHARGADLVDVGGESTRPGAVRVESAEELDRVLPVIIGLVAAGVPVSVDTMRADTAARAVEAGACIVNDVSGGLADPQMYRTVAGLHVPYVAMHWRGHSDRMADLTDYDDVLTDVCAELSSRASHAEAAGIAPDRIILDPGLGFAKEADHNWALLRGLSELQTLGFPLLVGASRKRFLGALLAGDDGVARPVDGRDMATDAITALAAAIGVWAVRVAQAWTEGRDPRDSEATRA